MTKKPPTKAEQAHMARVIELGCIVCMNKGYGFSPAEIHHPRNGQGLSQRANHKDGIPLCPQHHRLGGYGVAIGAGQKRWEELYGTERKLLEQVIGILEVK
ncbi:MAG: Ref family recombination enhancement nuclease [Anaerolineae bacterium]|nr:MAG: Ref family recombination enhancement nuclease [Anaerolineae bacterium]